MMTPERWQQVRRVLAEALELAPGQRPAFLERACSTDHSLRREVESLLSSSNDVRSSFMQSAPDARLTLTKGTRLGDFEILSLLGAGGMGEVYRARDRRLEREVAIKVLPRFVSFDPERLRRFEQEAKAAAALNHPNILAVFQMGTYEGAPYLVSELLEGETLREQLKHGPIPLKKAIDYGVQIVHGLAAAHEKGIVHRDLKPENLFVTGDSRIKILDFGLAKLTHPETETQVTKETLDTKPGAVLGTVGYMSPEQLEGDPVDPRTDVYALGLVLYELATGRNPFLGQSPSSTIANILKEEVPPVARHNPVAPPELDRILQKCLRKRMEGRYASARDFAVDLTALRRSLEPAAAGSAVTPAEPAAPFSMSRGAIRGLLELIQVGYLAMYGLALYKFHDVLRASHELYASIVLGEVLLTAAVLGVPVRLYQFTAISFDYPDLGRKFRQLFPAVLLLDVVWAAVPLLFLGQLQGLVLVCAAALAFLPFSQRTLVYAAYARSGGRSSAIQVGPKSLPNPNLGA